MHEKGAGMKLYSLLFLFLMVLLQGIPSANAQSIRYVNHASSGANNGNSWEDAFVFLQDALAAAVDGDEVWVATGTYWPDQGAGVTEGDRTASFILKNNVGIYGGFTGNELSRAERNWEVNEMILSGDLLENDSGELSLEEPTRSDNSYHVVTAKGGTDTTAVLDGFTIRRGHANPPRGFQFGGGLIVEFNEEFAPTLSLKRLKFEENLSMQCGGGAANLGGAISLAESHWVRNIAVATSFCGGGGAFYHWPFPAGSMAILYSNFFEDNESPQGGALSIFAGSIAVKESLFLSNRSTLEGGAVHHNQVNSLFDSEAIYANVVFSGNKSNEFGGGAMSSESSTITVYNTLFSGNEAVDTGGVCCNGLGALGGAIVGIENSVTTVIQSTFVNNEARYGGAISGSVSTNFHVFNSIFWGNKSHEPTHPDFDISGFEILEIGHSIVESGLPEEVIDKGGNLNEDPLFINPLGMDNLSGTLDDNLRLISGSPAINAGDNSVLPSDLLDLDRDGDLVELIPVDLDHNQRIADVRVDIGSYEFNTISIGNSDEPKILTEVCSAGNLTPAYPNPFSTTVHLTFCVQKTGPIQVVLYDILGKMRRLLLENTARAGFKYSFEIEGEDLPNGVYIVRLQGVDLNVSQRIILLK